MKNRNIRTKAALIAAGIFLFVVGLLVPAEAQAQGGSLVVGDVSFPSLRWGEQQAVVEITNNSHYLKFIVAETEIQFDGTYLHPQRRVRSHHVVPPGESDTIEAGILVPGNFGEADIRLRLYDVVDTLDAILPGQKFFEQPFLVVFNIPEGLFPYVGTRITLPPRVENHPYFDNEFSRILMILLSEGKEAGEIATMSDCDTSFVRRQIELMADVGYARKTEDGVELRMTVVRQEEADAAREHAVRLADSLTELIADQIDGLARVRDSLVAAGAISPDSNAFFDPGAVLHHPYPVVGALALWWDLGNVFITRSAPLYIYDGTDLCNAAIPTYMYAVEGGAVVNGHQFYAPIVNRSSFEILFGDTIPAIECDEDFLRYRQRPAAVRWQPTEEYFQTNYVFDSTVVRPAVEAITAGADSLLWRTYEAVRDMAVDQYGHARLDYGYRYWFWNLVATRTLEALVKRGAVERTGNGQFKITALQF